MEYCSVMNNDINDDIVRDGYCIAANIEFDMSIHLTKAIQTLKSNLLQLASLAENQLEQALLSLNERNIELAKEVADKDNILDQKEVDIEEECLRILALYQPVAFDLRFVIAVLKINSDLERIGDLAAGIALRAIDLIQSNAVRDDFDFNDMSKQVLNMLRHAIESLVNLNPKQATAVSESDPQIDALHNDNMKRVIDNLLRNPSNAQSTVNYLVISRNLERIADQTTNIAEDVVYLVDGKIIRHDL